MSGSARRPRSLSHSQLGALLRQARIDAGARTRDLGFSSGHLSNVEGGYVTPSRDLLDAYIRLGADRVAAYSLLDHIVAQSQLQRAVSRRRSRGDDSSGPAAPPNRVDENTGPDDVRLHYTVERYDVQFDFGASGAIASVSSRVDIRALHSGTRFYYTGHSPDARASVAQTVSLTVGRGGVVEQVNASPLGATDVFIRLSHELSPDDPHPHVLRYDVDLGDKRRADPQIVYVTRPGICRHALIARFTPPVVPERLWWFAASNIYDADRDGATRELEPVEEHRYEHRFDPIIPGWCYGFSWLWNDRNDS